MLIRSPAFIAPLMLVAALPFGLMACSPAEQDNAQSEASETAAETGQAAEKAGSALAEEASQVGSAVAAGAKEAAQEVDEATDALARKADEQKAETAADNRGNVTPN